MHSHGGLLQLTFSLWQGFRYRLLQYNAKTMRFPYLNATESNIFNTNKILDRNRGHIT
jgi:hypothetical protein